MINIFHDVEKLKKELWYLNRFTIPKLQENIENLSGFDITDISNSILTLKQDVSTLEKSLSDQDLTISKLSTNIVDIQKSVEGIIDNYSKMLNSHNGLVNYVNDMSTKQTELSNQILVINENISQLSNSITNITLLTDQNASEISSLKTDVNSSVNTLNNKLISLENNNTTTLNEIETLKAEINSIKSQLGNVSSGSSLDFDVLYDMRSEDPLINRGVTAGAVGGTTFNIDLLPYRYLRLFGYVNSYECQDFIKITDRNRTDFTMMSVSTNMKSLNFLKYAIPITLDKIQFSNYGCYTYSTQSFAFSYAYGKTNENYYVYRIEGIK